MRPIRAITLDLDDTLWPVEPTIQRAERLAHQWLAERAPEPRAVSGRYRIASLSNGNASLAQIGLDHLFHATISAHAYGTSKPDPALFHITCRELGCAPEEVVHLGDDIELDIRGAGVAGLHAVWINRASNSWPGDDAPVTVADLEAFERWLAQS